MAHPRTFRFGLQLATAPTAAAWAEQAKKAEDLGFSSLLMPDPKVIDMFMTIGCADPGGNFHVTKTEPVETVRLDVMPDLPAGGPKP